MRKSLFACLLLLLGTHQALAGPKEDAAVLFGILVGASDVVAASLNAERSEDTAMLLETSVYNRVVEAQQAFDRRSFEYDATPYNRYADYAPCARAARLMTYLSAEAIQHHRGVDQSQKYRHAQPFIEQFQVCADLITP